MRARQLGLLLRLLGPLIQLIALAIATLAPGRLPWDRLAGLFLLGLGLVLFGIVLSRRPNRPARDADDSTRLRL